MLEGQIMKKVRYRTGIFKKHMIINDADIIIRITDEEGFHYKFVFYNPCKELQLIRRLKPGVFFRQRQDWGMSQDWENQFEYEHKIMVEYYEKIN